jgi:hypothetical protein
VFGLPRPVYVLPPADAGDDPDDGGGCVVAVREALDFGAVAEDDVAGGLDDEAPAVVADDDATGVDGAPAPVPWPGEDVLHAASASATIATSAAATL